MTVKIIITRKVPKNTEKELLPLIKELRIATTRQEGYISGETLQRIDKPGETVVVSTWEREEDWNRWVTSPERSILQEKIDALLGQDGQAAVECLFAQLGECLGGSEYAARVLAVDLTNGNELPNCESVDDGAIYIDNPEAVFACGDWVFVSGIPQSYAGNHSYHASGSGSCTATWTPDIPAAGN